MSEPLVSIIIVNFNGVDFLEDLFGSIHAQTYKNWEVIFVDNHSSDDSIHHLHVLSDKYALGTKLKIVQLPTNTGFAMGNAKGIELSTGKYLLFLNTDVSMEKSALASMVNVMESQPQLAGVNPKVYLSKFLPHKIFDNIGICLDKNCSPYNRGIGQIDLGQYDDSEDILGVCFACTLINKQIYEKVGGLDTDYFAYFEDVDWNIRARKMGYSFMSTPNAVTYHLHSGTSNKESGAWKFHLIFRNYLRTATKSLGKRQSILVVLRKLLDLTVMAVRSGASAEVRIACIKIIMNYCFIDSWRYTAKRYSAQKNFIPEITDSYLYSYSTNEPSDFFDESSYTPRISMRMYDYIFSRMLKSSPKLITWKRIYKSYYASNYTTKWKPVFDQFMKPYNMQK